MNDIKQVILIKSKTKKDICSVTKDMTNMSSVLSHFRALSVVCNTAVDIYDLYHNERKIENEVLESLKVCPWIEMLHVNYSKSQFVKYFLGSEAKLLKKARSDLKKFPSSIEKAQPCWPHLSFIKLADDFDTNEWLSIYGILKNVCYKEMPEEIISSYSQYKKNKIFQVFKGHISSFHVSHAKVILEEDLFVKQGPISVNFENFGCLMSPQELEKIFIESKPYIEKLIEDGKHQVLFNFKEHGFNLHEIQQYDWFKKVKINIRSKNLEIFHSPTFQNLQEIETVQFQFSLLDQYCGKFETPVKFFDLNIEGREVSEISEKGLSSEVYDFNVVLDQFPNISTLRIRFDAYHNFYTTIKISLESRTTIQTLILEYPDDDHKKAFEFFENLDQHKPPNAKCFIVLNSGRIQGPLTFEKVSLLNQKGWTLLPPARGCNQYNECQHMKKYNWSYKGFMFNERECYLADGNNL